MAVFVLLTLQMFFLINLIAYKQKNEKILFKAQVGIKLNTCVEVGMVSYYLLLVFN